MCGFGVLDALSVALERRRFRGRRRGRRRRRVARCASSRVTGRTMCHQRTRPTTAKRDPGEQRADRHPHEDGQRRRHRCVIREAATAAPNPLSMFTTVTPAAQLFSIVSSGAIPWKDAP